MGELTWPQRGRLWLRLGIRLVLFLLVLLLLARFGPFLLSVLMPFLLAAGVAWLLNPAVGWLHKKLGWPRKLLSLLLILLAFAAIFGLLWALIASLVSEVAALAGNWTSLVAALEGTATAAGEAFSRLLDLLPPTVRDTADALTARLFEWLETVIPRVLGMAVDYAANMAKGLPSFAVAAVAFLMASYFITADYPSLRARVANRLPQGPRFFFVQVKRAVSAGFGGYLKAEIIISIGVFFILLGGFLLIHQDYAILLALGLAVLDFIPILGSGTVMVPWAVVDLFMGDFRHAVGLGVVWGLVALFRRLAEPKILGDQTGLSPILSLVSIYVGMRLGGVAGMILAPVLCLVVLNITEAGVFENIFADLRLAAQDIAAILAPEHNSKNS